MSFGFSASDVVLLVQSAWTTVQNSRKACGEYADLTREITSLHVNLRRLEREIAKPESPINRPSDTCRQDLAPIIDGCGKELDVMDKILEKYNALSDEERSKGKLWKAVRFGNGELANVKDLRLKLTYYTSNLSLFLNMVSMGSMGVVEKHMYEAGGDLKEIRRAVNGITAHLMSSANKEGSVLTDYADDDKAVWRAFRRELVKEGFSSDVIREHKDTIQAYVIELGSRGILDNEDSKDPGNISEEIEDNAPAQASRDETMGSFENKSGAARDGLSPRTGTSAHVDGFFANRDPREDQTFPLQTQTVPAPLTMRLNVSDYLASSTQTTAKINGVGRVDDRTNRYPSPFPSPLTQSPPELAEEDTWLISGNTSRQAFRYFSHEFYGGIRGLFQVHSISPTKQDEFCDALSDPCVSRGETLEFQEEAKAFLKVAEVITRLRKRGSKSDGQSLLKLSPLFEDLTLDRLHRVAFSTVPNTRTIIDLLLRYGLRKIDDRPEKWRITKWPSPREKTKSERHEVGDKSKRSTVPHAAPAVRKGTQYPSSITEKVKTKEDDDIVEEPVKEAKAMKEERPKNLSFSLAAKLLSTTLL